MPSYKVAHLHEQGQDMIIVPLDDRFGRKTSDEQHEFINELQAAAMSAGLRGKVVPVWNGGFIAPKPWHPFFRTFGVSRAQANINRELSW